MNTLLSNARVPLLGFAAASGTGKTTLLKHLIPLLKQRGYRVGLIKRSHHDFEIDYPGKDSHELRMAGASPVMLSASTRRALITEHTKERTCTLNEELAFFDQSEVDLILVEGFKKEPFPKIEICRLECGQPRLYLDDPYMIAVAIDQPVSLSSPIPLLDLNNPESIVSFILSTCSITPPTDC
ncbi:MAG: molybdopterin-guanine dinucleotide biosynthesis protein B [Methylococcaceae bacterium]